MPVFTIHNLNPKYVSYFFQTEQFQNQKRQYITGAKVRRVNADNLSKILIPVPSMEIQERIVSILDKFDTLTNSITEGLPREIELRQKQYEYYRDLLFSFPKPETDHCYRPGHLNTRSVYRLFFTRRKSLLTPFRPLPGGTKDAL